MLPHFTYRWSLTLFSIVLLATVSVGSVVAKTPVAGSVDLSINIEQKLVEIEQSSSLDGSLRNKLLDIYRQVQDQMSLRQDFVKRAKNFKEDIKLNPKRFQRNEQQLSRLETKTAERKSDESFARLTLQQLEHGFIKAQSEYLVIEDHVRTLVRRLQSQITRPVSVREDKAAAEKAYRAVREANDIQVGEGVSQLVLDGQMILLSHSRAAREAEIEMYEQELLGQSLQLKYLRSERKLGVYRETQARTHLHQIEAALNTKRQQEAVQTQLEIERVEKAAGDKHPLIQTQAELNTKLSRELSQLALKLANSTKEKARLEAKFKRIDHDYLSSQQKLDIAGFSEVVGQFLRDERNRLPDLSRYKRSSKQRKKEIAKAGLSQLQMDEQRHDLESVDDFISRIVETRSANKPVDEDELRKEVSLLLKVRSDLLDKGGVDYGAYVRALAGVDIAETKLSDVVNQYTKFLDEHLLWIPNTVPLKFSVLANLGKAVGGILSPSSWSKAVRIVLDDLRQNPLLALLAIFIGGILFRLRGTLHRAVRAMSGRVQRPYADRFTYTVQAFGFTLMLSILIPLVLAFLGWRLEAAENADDFSKAVGHGLFRISFPLFALQTFWNLCRHGGVAVKHFQWSELTIGVLRRNLFWFMLLSIPVLFVATFTKHFDGGAYYSSLGRIALITIMIALSWFLSRLLHPSSGVTVSYLADSNGWLSKLSFFWYTGIVALPLAFAGLAIAGYHHTAVSLLDLILTSFWVIVGAVIMHDMVIRWLTVTSRKLALLEAQEKREAIKAAQSVQISGEEAPELEMPGLDITTVDEQTRAILRISLWLASAVSVFFIWADVFPALGFLDTLNVWQETIVVDGKEQLKYISVADVGVAVLLTFLVIVAARNLPAVLELVVLRRLALEPGSRYAATTVARYIIIAVGSVLIFNLIGGDWGEIQWLIAALSVGLGFGLQEIVANFISGIILLFEQPIRIGDTVTVGEVSGTVSKIRIRATTITDWDRKELIVPNKLFITEKMVNWSLTDPITRLVIRVGVAYGSDTKNAHAVMLDAVRSIPLVLEHPEPTVYFVSFGDSSLDFEVRVFVKTLDDRMPIMHELHMALEQALRENNIEIPFPQRVVHMAGSEVLPDS